MSEKMKIAREDKYITVSPSEIDPKEFVCLRTKDGVYQEPEYVLTRRVKFYNSDGTVIELRPGMEPV